MHNTEQGGRTPSSRSHPKRKPSVDRVAGAENCVGDLALYKEAVDYFAANAKNMYHRTQAAVTAGDHGLVHRITHREASLAATVGAARLSRIISTLSKEARARNIGAQKNLLIEYKIELARVIAEISSV